MVGHDPRGTNRSPDAGPAHPHLVFATRLLAGPALIGPDGSLYGWGRGGLRALDAEGRSRWVVPVLGLEGGPPALAPTGSLLVNGLTISGTGANRRAGMAVLAFDAATGTTRWAIHSLPWAPAVGGTFVVGGQAIPMGRSVPLSKGVAPLVAQDGTLYMPFVGPGSTNAGVEEISAAGRPLRRLEPNVEPVAMARSPDDTLYEVGMHGLVALDPAGRRLWERPMVGVSFGEGSVLDGANGTVYASDGRSVAAFSPAGKRLWRRKAGSRVEAMAERADGAVLAVSGTALTALTPQGTRLWQRSLGHPPEASPGASIAVDSAGRAYVERADGAVQAIGPGGARLWTLRAGRPTQLGVSPPGVAIGPRQTLVVAGSDGRMYVYR